MKYILRAVFPQTKEEDDNMMKWLTTPLVCNLRRGTVIVCIPFFFLFAAIFSSPIESLVLLYVLLGIGLGSFLLIDIWNATVQRIRRKRWKREEKECLP